MRKEVKLGMFIGGGLVALLVVYLLVAPPSNQKKGVQLADGAGNANIADVTAPGDVTTDNAAPPAAPTGDTTAAPAEPGNPGQTHTDDTAAPKKTGDTWNTMLDTGKTGTVAAKPAQPLDAQPIAKEADKTAADQRASDKPRATEKVALGNSTGAPEEAKLYYNPNAAWGGGLSTDGIATALRGNDGARTASAAQSAPSDVKASAPVAGGTHVVRSGETFSSIAQAAYGSAAYYPALLRANPNVNPNNLKLGTTITLPQLAEVKATAERPTSPVAASVAQDVKIDTTRQYKVQSGDSLYKISLKLYGKSTYVDRIYEANKQSIGADPKKLKLGMILELPEKPAAAGLASPRENSTSTLSGGPNFAEDQAK